jgi:hypothetical protein
MWHKSKVSKVKKQRQVDEESDLSFISKDDDEEVYDPLNPNVNFNRKRYYYASSSSGDLEEANYDEIEEEEFVSAMIGEKEDEEQLRILEMEE